MIILQRRSSRAYCLTSILLRTVYTTWMKTAISRLPGNIIVHHADNVSVSPY